MMRSGGGSIVFCTSAVARHGIPNHEAIAAAKAGVVGKCQGTRPFHLRRPASSPACVFLQCAHHVLH
jgi:NAD(P)-dependent dehydrogenase (short-subunit alcohol dehydrogenase family)